MGLEKYLVKAYDVSFTDFRGKDIYENILNAFLREKTGGFNIELVLRGGKLQFHWYYEENSINQKVSLTAKSLAEVGVENIESELKRLKFWLAKWREELKVVIYVDNNNLYDDYVSDVYSEQNIDFINDNYDPEFELDDWMLEVTELADEELIIIPFFAQMIDRKFSVDLEMLRRKKELYNRIHKGVLEGSFKNLDSKLLELLDINKSFGHFLILWAGRRCDTGELGRALWQLQRVKKLSLDGLIELLNKAEKRFSFRVVESGKIRRATQEEVNVAADNFYMEPTFPQLAENYKIICLALWMATDNLFYFRKLEYYSDGIDISKTFSDLIYQLENYKLEEMLLLPELSEEKYENLEKESCYKVGKTLSEYEELLLKSQSLLGKKYDWAYRMVNDLSGKNKNNKEFHFPYTPKQFNALRNILRFELKLTVPDEAFLEPEKYACSEVSIKRNNETIEKEKNPFGYKQKYTYESCKKLVGPLSKADALHYHSAKVRASGKSFALRVVDTIRNRRTCSEKQAAIIEEAFEILLKILSKNENTAVEKDFTEIDFNNLFAKENKNFVDADAEYSEENPFQ